MKLEERGRKVSERTDFSNGHESLLAQNKDITNLKKHVSVNFVSEGKICISSIFFHSIIHKNRCYEKNTQEKIKHLRIRRETLTEISPHSCTYALQQFFFNSMTTCRTPLFFHQFKIGHSDFLYPLWLSVRFLVFSLLQTIQTLP